MADAQDQRLHIEPNQQDQQPVMNNDQEQQQEPDIANEPPVPPYNARHFPVPPNAPAPGFAPAQFPPQPPHFVHQHRHMPSRYDRNAPKFNGKATSLRRFLEDVETLARECGISERDQIGYAISYLDEDDYEIWNSRASARGDSWYLFKQQILALYPGSEDNARYKVTDLELLVERQAATPMQDQAQFGEYYRNFLTQSSWLLNRGIISHRERNKFFLSGFHFEFRQQLRTQLRLQEPLHPLDEPWDMMEIEQAARFLLKGDNSGNILTAAVTNHPPAQPPAPSPYIPSPRQTFDMSSIEQILTSDTFLNRLAERISPPGRNASSSSYYPSSQHNSSQHRTYWPCGFCSDTDHLFRQCQKLNDYIHQGLCMRDSSNRICMPDGTMISNQTAPGRNMMERIDNWHKARPAPRVQANLFQVAPIAGTRNIPTTAMAYTTPPSTSSDEEELIRLEAVALANLKRQEEVRKRIANSGKTKGALTRQSSPSASNDPAPASVPKYSSPSTNPPVPTQNQQQYRFASAVEDPKTIQEVIKRSLEGTVTLTQRELYAIAPDVRKHIKDQVTTHRVPAGQSATTAVCEETDTTPVSALLHHNLSLPSNPVIVANPIEDLRTIPLELDGKVTVDAILDEGSQIIGIRRDIWERLGLPLLRDQGILMESANATTEMTLGLLRDLPVRIGASIFYLQVQVFENAPYEMLLGRPFLTLTQAQTHHYRNGDSHITLLDPNTKETITIPTAVRIRGPVQQSSTGF